MGRHGDRLKGVGGYLVLLAAVAISVGVLAGRKERGQAQRADLSGSAAAKEKPGRTTTMHRTPLSPSSDSPRPSAPFSRGHKNKPVSEFTTTVVDAEEARHPYVSEDLLSLPDSYSPESAFGGAAKEFQVPEDLLKAIAYVETQGDHRHGVRWPDGGFGVMKLREDPSLNTLEEAAALLKVEKKVLVQDPVQNIRGAAAVLRAYHDQAVQSGSQTPPWLTALTLFSGRSAEASVAYAREIENILFEGMTHTTSFSEEIVVAPRQDYLLTGKQPSPTPTTP